MKRKFTNAIVTGGAGFIGSHLSKYLVSKGINVIVIDNFSTGNVLNLKSIRSKITLVDSDISSSSIDEYFQDNIGQKLFVNTLTSVGYESINTTGQSTGPGGRGGVYTFSSHKGYLWAELISGEKLINMIYHYLHVILEFSAPSHAPNIVGRPIDWRR